MADTYNSFDELVAANQVDGSDFRIRSENRDSNVLIIAPHGGKIEKWTSEVALAIAGDNFSYYLFEGIKRQGGNGILHITSTRFDEPKALKMAKNSEYIVAVHGERNREKEIVYIGGMNIPIRDNMTIALEQNGFLVKRHQSDHLQGTNVNNICNRCKYHGVQLELTYKLRERLHESIEEMERFTAAARVGLQ